MVRPDQLRTWQRRLRSRWPIFGRRQRERALAELVANRNEPEVVDVLVEVLGMSSDIAEPARAALADLSAQAAVDRLCALWAVGRDERLGALLVERSYVAAAPQKLRILSALKCGIRIAVDRVEHLPEFLALRDDRDAAIRDSAERCLEKATGPAVDALCDEAIKNPAGPIATLCHRAKHRPRDHERLCLFLFVTGKLPGHLDEYFREDFEFQNLRLEYERADATVREHVMEIVRSGDRRCAGFFGRRKPLVQCTEPERRVAIASWLQHQEWPRVFQAGLEMPLRESLPLFQALRKSGWQPEAPDLRSVLKQVLTEVDAAAPPDASKPPPATSCLFEKWLARGANGEYAALSETELRDRLKTAAPPEGVALVAALARRGTLQPETEKMVSESPHWLIRLAWNAMTFASKPSKDSNYWITELASSAGVLDFWPAKATPDDLPRLANAPAEAWVGHIGAPRRILRAILQHRNTELEAHDVVVAPGATDVIVEDAP